MKQHGLPFSHEQKDFWHSPARTPAEALDFAIPYEQEKDYIHSKVLEQENTELYQMLLDVTIEIDEVFGTGRRLGSSFIDGTVVATDIVRRFAPYLLDNIRDLVDDDIQEQYDATFLRSDAPSHSKTRQREFVSYFLASQEGYLGDFSRDYRSLITRLAKAKYTEPDQANTMRTGFEFLMAHAKLALHEDNKELKNIEQGMQVGRIAISATELDLELQILLSQKEQYEP